MKSQLDVWRDAEHRLATSPLGSAEWEDAQEAACRADKAYHAELAQETARYAEAEFRNSNPSWFARLDRRPSGAGD